MPEMSQAVRRQLFDKFLKQESDVMEFRVDRTENAKKDDLTFSEAAMENVLYSVSTFIGARTLSFWERNKKPATGLVIHVQLEVS